MSVAAKENAPQETLNWWVLAAVGTGTFMAALDGSIANTVLPVLMHVLHGSVASVEWVVTVYLLVSSALVLSAGRWGDLHGHKPMYLTGFVVFIAGSVLCGLAPDIPILVVMRGVQALGATLLFASSPAIVTLNFPARVRGQALGMQATLTYLGLSAGPILGGWLTTHLSWHAAFYINVPVGLLALGLSQRFIPKDVPRPSSTKFDVLGAALFAAGLIALLTALNQGHAWGWTSPPVIALLASAVGLLTGFVLWERRAQSPMLDFGLFRERSFAAASVSATLSFISLSGLLFLLPFYLISGRGLSAAAAGFVIAALPIAMALVAPVSGWLSDRVGAALPATTGMVLLAVGTLLLSRLGPHAPLHLAAAALALSGVGIGVFLSPNNSSLMGSAPRSQQGIAAAVRATARNLGNVLGIGIVGAVFNSALAHHAARSALFPAVHAGLLTVCLAACLGAVASAVRGRSRLPDTPQIPLIGSKKPV